MSRSDQTHNQKILCDRGPVTDALVGARHLSDPVVEEARLAWNLASY